MKEERIVLGKSMVSKDGVALNKDTDIVIGPNSPTTLIFGGTKEVLEEVVVKICKGCSHKEQRAELKIIDYWSVKSLEELVSESTTYIDLMNSSNSYDIQEFDDLCTIIDYRCVLFRKRGCRNLNDFKEKFEEESINEIFVNIVGLTSVSAKSIKSLAQFLDKVMRLGRVAGVYLTVTDTTIKSVINICNNSRMWTSFSNIILMSTKTPTIPLDILDHGGRYISDNKFIGFVINGGDETNVKTFILQDHNNQDNQSWHLLDNLRDEHKLINNAIEIAGEFNDDGKIFINDSDYVDERTPVMIINVKSDFDEKVKQCSLDLIQKLEGKHVEYIQCDVESVSSNIIYELEKRLLNNVNSNYQIVFVTSGEEINLALMELVCLFGRKLNLRLIYFYKKEKELIKTLSSSRCTKVTI